LKHVFDNRKAISEYIISSPDSINRIIDAFITDMRTQKSDYTSDSASCPHKVPYSVPQRAPQSVQNSNQKKE
jgi:hypothetical protein